MPQNTKIEMELVVCIETGLGAFGLANRLTSHSSPPDFPSRIIIYIQDRNCTVNVWFHPHERGCRKQNLSKNGLCILNPTYPLCVIPDILLHHNIKYPIFVKVTKGGLTDWMRTQGRTCIWLDVAGYNSKCFNIVFEVLSQDKYEYNPSIGVL